MRFAALLTLLLTTLPAAAQDVQVRRGMQPIQGGPAQLGPGQLGSDPSAAAAEQARVGGLEEEIRRLTGRIEELEYQQQQLVDRVDKLVGDVDRRLSAVEGAGPASPAETPSGTAAPSSVAPPPSNAGNSRQGGVLGTIPPDAVARLPPPEASELGYDGGLSMLQAGRYGEAEQAFQAFIERNPEDPKVPTAAYWIAEGHYVQRDYQAAAAAFARNYRTYGPEAPRAPDNLLKLGMSLAAVGDTSRACQTFSELGRRHGNASAAVRQALARERDAAGCG